MKLYHIPVLHTIVKKISEKTAKSLHEIQDSDMTVFEERVRTKSINTLMIIS